MGKGKTKLTSVKLLDNIYREFRMISFQNGMSLQKVVNRAIYKYVTDVEFRNNVDNVTDLEVSGSNF